MQSPPQLTDTWDRPEPFVVQLRVEPEQIDPLGHTNNVHYLGWLQHCAMRHSAAVGLDFDEMLALGYAMAVRDAHMTYFAATFAGDELYVGDWVTANDGRLRATRSFQILRLADKACVMRAKLDYVCIKIASGRPSRMPEEFVRAYSVSPPTSLAG